jgi:response regulator RpfG family c-di-GMP phosphodiesterase
MLTQEMRKIPELADYIPPEYIDDIFQSSILHDIGKVGIPDAILLKPGRLTTEEFEVIKRHTTLGGDAIRAIESRIKESSFLLMGKEIAYHHHEKWDGSGYPKGLKGDEIPLSARIVALADVYDALTTKRFYKEAYSHEKSKQIILNLKHSHFDPQVVEAFVKLENAFNRVREEKLEEEMTLIEEPAQAMHS